MGQEISDRHFNKRDFELFEARLREETELLDAWFRDGVFSTSANKGGFELEAWLVDAQAKPASINQRYLDRLDNPLVVPELATFNVEINSTPLRLRDDAFSRMADELRVTWTKCGRVAEDLGARMAMIGILPTVGVEQLDLTHMSPMQRFRALNEQVLRLRAGRPLELNINGRERLYLEHADVMLESAATSFQIHLKVSPAEAVRVYNASKILAAPIVAACANSPYLFGCDLWDETRIPLFEQAVDVGATEFTKRVTFGIRYARKSVAECFRANYERFPLLLPQLMDEPPEKMAHLRLHNGTIWRWNRPLIGFDSDGRPHLRIEHRVVPSGPTVSDCIANAALYFGAVRALADQAEPPELEVSFEQARENFYAAARTGLDAEIQGVGGRRGKIQELLTDRLLPLARHGLKHLGIAQYEIDTWLGIVESRVRSRWTGAAWQRAFVERHNADMQALTEAYLARQEAGAPVHEWSL